MKSLVDIPTAVRFSNTPQIKIILKMANNVTNIIRIKANDEAIDSIDNRFDLAGGYGETTEFVKAFYDNPELTESGAVLNNWSLNHVGAKWIYVENCVDAGEWNIQSANYPPNEFLQRLFELVTEIDPDGYVENRYHDETYSPVGAQVFKKDSEGQPRWYEVENHDFETPDTDYDDDDYEINQMEFMDSIYEFHEDSILECHNIIDGGEAKEFKIIS
jgi:hypothetical protein